MRTGISPEKYMEEGLSDNTLNFSSRKSVRNVAGVLGVSIVPIKTGAGGTHPETPCLAK